MQSSKLVLILSCVLASCGDDPDVNPDPVDADLTLPDGGGAIDGADLPDADLSCNPLTDFDGDAIPSGLEGCEETPERDTDGDLVPDWKARCTANTCFRKK